MNNFGFINVLKCGDCMMWYSDKVGKKIKLSKPACFSKDVFWCNEDAGYLNIVKKEDAVFIGKIT